MILSSLEPLSEKPTALAVGSSHKDLADAEKKEKIRKHKNNHRTEEITTIKGYGDAQRQKKET